MDKRILFVVDVSNLYYTVGKRLGTRLDYKKLLPTVEQLACGKIHRAIAYGADREDEARSFKSLLRDFGYELKYKTPSEFQTNESVQRKADWDVGIAIDVVTILDSVDIVVFGTGDGDMEPCLQYVQSRGKQAFVIGAGISRLLKDTANGYHEITKEDCS